MVIWLHPSSTGVYPPPAAIPSGSPSRVLLSLLLWGLSLIAFSQSTHCLGTRCLIHPQLCWNFQILFSSSALSFKQTTRSSYLETSTPACPPGISVLALYSLLFTVFSVSVIHSITFARRHHRQNLLVSHIQLILMMLTD